MLFLWFPFKSEQGPPWKTEKPTQITFVFVQRLGTCCSFSGSPWFVEPRADAPVASIREERVGAGRRWSSAQPARHPSAFAARRQGIQFVIDSLSLCWYPREILFDQGIVAGYYRSTENCWTWFEPTSLFYLKGPTMFLNMYTYLDPQKGTFFCSLRYFCSFCQLSGISEIYAETANFMFRTHFVANPANLATRNARKSAENARKSAENARKSAEHARKSAESPKPTCFEHGWSNRNVFFFLVNERVFQQCACFFAF